MILASLLAQDTPFAGQLPFPLLSPLPLPLSSQGLSGVLFALVSASGYALPHIYSETSSAPYLGASTSLPFYFIFFIQIHIGLTEFDPVILLLV